MAQVMHYFDTGLCDLGARIWVRKVGVACINVGTWSNSWQEFPDADGFGFDG